MKSIPMDPSNTSGRWIGFACLGSAALLLLGLTVWAVLDKYVPGEDGLLLAIVKNRIPALNPVAQMISALGSVNLVLPVWVVSLAAVAWRSLRAHRAERALALLPVPLGYPIYLLMKTWIARPSPMEPVVSRLYDTSLGYYLEGLFRRQVQTLPAAGVSVPAVSEPVTAQAVVRVIESGYPSGHALLAVLLYGGLAIAAWKLVRPGNLRRAVVTGCVILAATIGLVRIYMGLHYPSDVLGAWSLGIVLLAISEFTANAVVRWWNARAHGKK